MACIYENLEINIKIVGTSMGPETEHPVRVITSGGVYTNYTAQLILDFLKEGKLPEFRCSPDYAKELYTILMIEGNQLDKANEENEKLKEELKLVQENNDKFAEDIRQAVKQKNALEKELGEVITERYKENQMLTTRNNELKQQLNELEAEHERDANRLRDDLAESHANNMELAADLVFTKTRLDEANKKLLNNRYGLQSMTCDELLAENRRLLEKQANLECQINVLNTVSDGYKEEIDDLTQENEKLKHTNMLISNNLFTTISSRNKYHHLYDQLMAENKHLLSEIEALKAGYLVGIFAEFVDKDRKNRAYLDEKIEEFKKNISLNN